MAGYFKINGRWVEWHVGELLPTGITRQQVVTMQMDGHELQAVWEGLEKGLREKDSWGAP